MSAIHFVLSPRSFWSLCCTSKMWVYSVCVCARRWVNLCMVTQVLDKDVVCGSHVAWPELSAYTPACLAWHVLFSLSGFSHFKADSSKVVSLWWPGIAVLVWHLGFSAGQLRQPVFQHKYVTNVEGKINKKPSSCERRSPIDHIKRLSKLQYTSEECLNFTGPSPLHLS